MKPPATSSASPSPLFVGGALPAQPSPSDVPAQAASVALPAPIGTLPREIEVETAVTALELTAVDVQVEEQRQEQELLEALPFPDLETDLLETTEVPASSQISPSARITAPAFGIAKPLVLPRRQEELQALASPLPLPPGIRTRTAALFAHRTGSGSTSLTIRQGQEWFLFAQMRERHGWASFNMKSSHFVEATRVYNDALKQLCEKHPTGLKYDAKNPRAIMKELGNFEEMVAQHIASGNFACTLSLASALTRAHDPSDLSLQHNPGTLSSGSGTVSQCSSARSLKVALLPAKARRAAARKR